MSGLVSILLWLVVVAMVPLFVVLVLVWFLLGGLT